MRYEYYQVIGLQRTGTNWLNELIKLNFDVQPVDRGFWKHLTPLGTKHHASRRFKHWKHQAEELVLTKSVFYIATSKEWGMFVESLNRNAEDFGKTHNGVRPNHDVEGTKKVYEAWHNWKAKQMHKPNFYYHDYMDWLRYTENYLEDIHMRTNWTRRHRTWQPVRKAVYGSKDFDINNYIMKENTNGEDN